MKRKMWRVLGLLIMCVAMSVMMCACGSESEGAVTMEDILDEVSDWAQSNYGQVYELEDVSCDVLSSEAVDDVTKYQVSYTCKTEQKASNVEELPFVMGLREASKEADLTDEEQETVDKYVESLAEDTDFAEQGEINVTIVVCVDNNDSSAAHEMYYLDANDEMRPIDELEVDTDQLYADGQAALAEILE